MAKEKAEKAEKELSTMEDIWDEVESLYGKDEMDDVSVSKAIVSSGSYALDDALGCWGLLGGRIIQFAGKESSGKTLMALAAIKEWQALSPRNWALFIDCEFTLDLNWAATLGVDTSEKRLKVWKINDGEKIFERLYGVPHKEPGKPKVKPGLLDIVKRAGGAEKSGLGLIVLDSIVAIQVPLEMASGVGKNNMALMARFLPPVLRKITPLLSETGVSLISINQIRLNPGQLFGNPETVPGGSCWKHYCSVMVHFTPLTGKESKILDENETQIGHTVLSKITKNKGGPPFRTCNFNIEYLKGVVDKHIEIGELAIKYGVIARPTKRLFIYKEYEWDGKNAFHKALKEEYDKGGNNLVMEMLEEVKKAKAAGVQVREAKESGEDFPEE